MEEGWAARHRWTILGEIWGTELLLCLSFPMHT